MMTAGPFGGHVKDMGRDMGVPSFCQELSTERAVADGCLGETCLANELL